MDGTLAPYDDAEVLMSQKTVGRITFLEVLIAIAIIVALIKWLPPEWNK